MLKKSLITLSSILFATTASAQSDIYGRCAEAIDAENVELVVELANTMQRFNQHPARKIEAAEACVSEARGAPVRFDRATGDFIDQGEYEVMIEANEANRLAQEATQEAAQSQRMQARALVQSRRETNQQLIALGIYNSCTELFNGDQISAMTNEACLNSFRANGHPNHPSLWLYQADQN